MIREGHPRIEINRNNASVCSIFIHNPIQITQFTFQDSSFGAVFAAMEQGRVKSLRISGFIYILFFYLLSKQQIAFQKLLC